VSLDPNIYYLGGSLYGDGGSVVNPSTGATTAQFFTSSQALQSMVTLDSTLSRAYFYYQDQTTANPLWTMATYNLQTQAIRELTRVSGCTLFPGGVNGKAGRIVRFGTNGLAVTCNEGIEILSGNFVTN
jgi:hypothetical protein